MRHCLRRRSAVKRQARLGECMHASATDGKQSVSSKKNTYGLSENEKVLSVITRWGTYAGMKVSQVAFGDPMFVAMFQVAHGPHETKDLVSKLSRRDFKDFMIVEFQVTSPCSISCHMLQWHCGNAFSQAQHDGGSRHGVKYQVLDMQDVPPGLDKNLVLCIGLDLLVDSKGDTVALGLDDASFNVLGVHEVELPRHSIVGIQVS